MNLLLRNKIDRSKPNRRDFMLQSSAASLGLTSVINSLAQMKLIGTAAAQTGGDYKALVCFFLNGGNDSNNLLIPATSGAARSDYDTGRGVLAIPDTDFDFTPTNGANGYWNGSANSTAAVSTRITPLNAASAYEPSNRTAGYLSGGLALHQGAYPLKTMFDAGDLSFICNVGTLVGTQTVTRANFNSLPVAAKPPQLFSHSDQQTQWQSSLPDQPFTRGWGGKIADLLQGLNTGDLSMSVSIAGVNSFQVAYDQPAYFMSSSGTVSALSGYSGGSPSTNYGSALRNTNLQPFYGTGSTPGGKYSPLANIASNTADPLAGTNYQHTAAGWRLRAIEQIMALQHDSLLDNGYNGAPENARVTEGLVGNALSYSDANYPTLTGNWNNWFPNNLFNPRIPDIANQMMTVARLIAGRSALSNTRQIFFVQLGGWDTHTSQIPGGTTAGQYSLINQMSRAIRAFKDAMVQIGMWNNVLLFSASDFTRTLTPNKNDSSGGSDHAWGGHMFVAGGPVKGGKIFGKFPDLTINGGIDCTGNRGRWIPSTATDQVFASVAKWFGCTDNQISTVLPNFTRFQSDLTAGTLTAKNLDFLNFT